MTEAQGDEIIDLLRDILSELKDMKSEFDEFTGYNVHNMGTVADEIIDKITGGTCGVGGANLEEVAERLGSIDTVLTLIEGNTSP